MLQLILAGVFFLNGISAEAPISTNYLPPAPFQGYPPSRPHPPPLGDPEEDLESIVIEAPSFTRTINPNQAYGTPAAEFSSARSNHGHVSTSVQQNSNTGASFTHFPGTSRTYNAPSYVYRGNQNNYARTNQHAPATLQTLASFNSLPPYAARSGSTSYHHFNENIQTNHLNTKYSDSHLGASINSYYQSPVARPELKEQYHYQRDINNNYPARDNSLHDKYDLPLHVTHSVHSVENQYLPPVRSIEQHSNDGYAYDRPSIPFNF